MLAVYFRVVPDGVRAVRAAVRRRRNRARGSDRWRASRARTFFIVKPPGSRPGRTSFHASGVETVAPGRPGGRTAGRRGDRGRSATRRCTPARRASPCGSQRRPVGQSPATRPATSAPRPAPRRISRGVQGVRTCRPDLPDVLTNDSTPSSFERRLDRLGHGDRVAEGAPCPGRGRRARSRAGRGPRPARPRRETSASPDSRGRAASRASLTSA